LRFGAEKGFQLRVVQPHRRLPQIAQLHHLLKRGIERRDQARQKPRQRPRFEIRLADGSSDRRNHRRAVRIPMLAHVKDGEGIQFSATLDKRHHRARDIGQVCPLMTDTGFAGIGHALDRAAGRDHALREPAVRRAGSEEISGANDENAGALLLARLAEPSFQLDANAALARFGILRRCFRNVGKCVRTVVVDGAGQHDQRTFRASGRDGVVDHRQDQLRPIAIAGRIDRVNDDGGAHGGLSHVRCGHRVALYPGDVRSPW
jgi:hypothetical protein